MTKWLSFDIAIQVLSVKWSIRLDCTGFAFISFHHCSSIRKKGLNCSYHKLCEFLELFHILIHFVFELLSAWIGWVLFRNMAVSLKFLIFLYAVAWCCKLKYLKFIFLEWRMDPCAGCGFQKCRAEALRDVLMPPTNLVQFPRDIAFTWHCTVNWYSTNAVVSSTKKSEYLLHSVKTINTLSFSVISL